MELIIKISLLSCFLILLFTKIGLRERLMIHANKFFYKLLNCDFCLSFWLNLLVSLCYMAYTKDISIWYYFIIATPITKKIL